MVQSRSLCQVSSQREVIVALPVRRFVSLLLPYCCHEASEREPNFLVSYDLQGFWWRALYDYALNPLDVAISQPWLVRCLSDVKTTVFLASGAACFGGSGIAADREVEVYKRAFAEKT